MSYSSFAASSSLIFLVLLLPLLLLTAALSQQPPATMANCGPLLLPLVPCAPFVQGIATSPTQPCCNSLSQLYTQQPSCLCFLLNNNSTTSSFFTTFPINTTLATDLANLCSLLADNTTLCSGVPVPAANAPASHQVPSGPHPNSTIAASPIVMMTPKSSILGYGRSGGTKMEINSYSIVFVAACTSISVLIYHF